MGCKVNVYVEARKVDFVELDMGEVRSDWGIIACVISPTANSVYRNTVNESIDVPQIESTLLRFLPLSRKHHPAIENSRLDD